MSNSKTIAKNTLFLYFRMILTILVSLYTSRIVLEYLGVDDFGLYNVVGGIVAMLTFVNSSMSSATQRFLSISLGKDDNVKEAQKVFSSALVIHILISVFFLFVAETLGLWFVLNKINIPEGRYYAAQIVYQFSVFSAIIGFLNVPYNASLIATEKMSAFAYISIVESILKLCVAFSLIYSKSDKLILYAILIFFVQLIIRMIYFFYCRKNVPFCKLNVRQSNTKIKEMLGYSSWMFFGTGTQLLSTQGVNILINLFFSVVINAARGIAIQVNGIVEGFVSNFMTAVQPRLIKLYASNQLEEMKKIISQASRFGFVLVCLLIFPLLITTEFVINLWLGQVPEKVVLFIRLVLANMLIVVLYSPLASIIFASGKVKVYQLSISFCFLSVFLFSYLSFYVGFPDYSTFLISLFFSILGLLVRLYVVKNTINFSIKQYFSDTVIPLFALLISFIIPFLVNSSLNSSLLSFCVIVIVSSVSLLFTTWLFVVKKDEKLIIKKVILQYVKNR